MMLRRCVGNDVDRRSVMPAVFLAETRYKSGAKSTGMAENASAVLRRNSTENSTPETSTCSYCLNGKSGKYVVKIDKTVRGTINGGGQELQFKNYQGSIYIKKAGKSAD